MQSRNKADYVVIEKLDERGRYISEKEFVWLINYFRDRYDPRRLALGLAYTTGLRWDDARKARVNWFNEDFSFMKMGQCKPRRRVVNGKLRLYKEPRNVPLPKWLSTDILHFAKFRLLLAEYIGEGIDQFRLFPLLKKNAMTSFFDKLRRRHGEKNKWLLDIYQIEKGYNKKHQLLWELPRYRVASHACRANYCTKAHEVSNGDYVKGIKLTGHRDIEDYQRYVKFIDIAQKKEEIRENYMEGLRQIATIPLLKGQKRLDSF